MSQELIKFLGNSTWLPDRLATIGSFTRLIQTPTSVEQLSSRALIPDNPQLDPRSLGERSQRVNITAPNAQFRNTGRESRARIQVGNLSRGNKWAATNRTLISPLRGCFLLDHQHKYAASSKTTAQSIFPIA